MVTKKHRLNAFNNVYVELIFTILADKSQQVQSLPKSVT